MRPQTAIAGFVGLIAGLSAVLFWRGESSKHWAAADACTLDALPSQPIDRIDYDRVPLTIVLDDLSRRAGAPLMTSPEALDLIANQDVTLHLRNLPLKDLLEIALFQAHTNPAVGFRPIHGVIEVRETRELEATQVVRAYDVADLLAHPPTRVRVPEPVSQFASSANGNAQSTELWSDDDANALARAVQESASTFTANMVLLEPTVATFDDTLIVVTTPERQLLVADILNRLREVQRSRQP